MDGTGFKQRETDSRKLTLLLLGVSYWLFLQSESLNHPVFDSVVLLTEKIDTMERSNQRNFETRTVVIWDLRRPSRLWKKVDGGKRAKKVIK